MAIIVLLLFQSLLLFPHIAHAQSIVHTDVQSDLLESGYTRSSLAVHLKKKPYNKMYSEFAKVSNACGITFVNIL